MNPIDAPEIRLYYEWLRVNDPRYPDCCRGHVHVQVTREHIEEFQQELTA